MRSVPVDPDALAGRELTGLTVGWHVFGSDELDPFCSTSRSVDAIGFVMTLDGRDVVLLNDADELVIPEDRLPAFHEDAIAQSAW